MRGCCGGKRTLPLTVTPRGLGPRAFGVGRPDEQGRAVIGSSAPLRSNVATPPLGHVSVRTLAPVAVTIHGHVAKTEQTESGRKWVAWCTCGWFSFVNDREPIVAASMARHLINAYRAQKEYERTGVPVRQPVYEPLTSMPTAAQRERRHKRKGERPRDPRPVSQPRPNLGGTT